MKQTTKKPVTAMAAERFSEGLEAAKRQLTQVEKDIATEAKKQRKTIEKVIARVRSGQDLKLIEKQLTTKAADLQSRVRAVPRDVLSALGVATADDVAKLSRNLSKLAKRVDELTKTKIAA
jgi:predicted regulator of amino acid metabolism with ACT domain